MHIKIIQKNRLQQKIVNILFVVIQNVKYMYFIIKKIHVIDKEVKKSFTKT